MLHLLVYGCEVDTPSAAEVVGLPLFQGWETEKSGHRQEVERADGARWHVRELPH